MTLYTPIDPARTSDDIKRAPALGYFVPRADLKLIRRLIALGRIEMAVGVIDAHLRRTPRLATKAEDI